VRNPLFAGVDGGGTKTAIVVVDADGNVIAQDTTTTSNSAVIGHERAASTLRQLIESTVAGAGAQLPLTSLWCGLSGSDRPEDHRQLRPRLEDLAETLQMTNDAELAIGGLPDRVGVALVSGTGSIAYGRNAAGTRARAGGWGHIFSDEGSGYDVARQALRAFSAETDGYGPLTSITRRFMEYWELQDPFTIINRVYDPNTTKGDIARLSRIVVDEAAKRDEVSCQIISRTAEDLARIAKAVATRLELGPELSLAMVGGMLINVEPFRIQVVDHLAKDWTIAHVELVHDPALTAARSLAAAWKGARA
jgi:N-acetylglucosamine kinase-like BadF-type ATPase